jgi:hypothetical protein
MVVTVNIKLEQDFSLFHTGLHQMHIQNYTLSIGCLIKEFRELLHWERTILSTGHILGNPMQELRHEILIQVSVIFKNPKMTAYLILQIYRLNP